MKTGESSRTPVTFILCVLWCVVFAWMTLLRGFRGVGFDNFLYGSFIPTPLSHLLGDVTPRDLYAGQFWRAVTATFVHFNALHLLLNLLGLVQLGRLVETWYGSFAFLIIYVLIGAAANLGANLARPWLVADPTTGFLMHSGGGSTVVLGLVGLVTVVGWRNPGEFPKRVRWWLVALLVFNGGLGLLLPRIDNLGHLAGVVAGGIVGLMDPKWIRWREKRADALPGVLAVGVVAACFVLMLRHQGREQRAAQELVRAQLVRDGLGSLLATYEQLALKPLWYRKVMIPKGPSRYTLPILPLEEEKERERLLKKSLKAQIAGFARSFPTNGESIEQRAARGISLLGARALSKLPTDNERSTFRNCIQALASRNAVELAERQEKYRALNNPEPRFGKVLLGKHRSPQPTSPNQIAAPAGGGPATAIPPPGQARLKPDRPAP